MATNNLYWCHTCNCFVQIHTNAVTCPQCTGEFVEQMVKPDQNPLGFLHCFQQSTIPEELSSPFNPVIAFRFADTTGTNNNNFLLFNYFGPDKNMQRLPDSTSDIIMRNGLERLLGELSQIFDTSEDRSLVESMPIVDINWMHIGSDSHSHCEVCNDSFELGSEAREMPCRHIYHEDCILMWLSSISSCPVCGYQMPTDGARRGGQVNGNGLAALTIWMLPSGGFAVGHFSATGREDETGLPFVYTEVDGSFNTNVDELGEGPWTTRSTGSTPGNGFWASVQRVFGFFSQSSSNSN